MRTDALRAEVRAAQRGGDADRAQASKVASASPPPEIVDWARQNAAALEVEKHAGRQAPGDRLARHRLQAR
ncbi:hypothetical protein GCM10010404_78770 [Nonomuraea africana]